MFFKLPPHIALSLLLVVCFIPIHSVDAEEVFLDFNDAPFGDTSRWYSPLPYDQHDFYADRGVEFECSHDDVLAWVYDCVTVAMFDGGNQAFWWAKHDLNNNRRMHWRFPNGATNISLDVFGLWQPNVAQIEWIGEDGRRIFLSSNADYAEGFTYEDLQGWSNEEYIANTNNTFRYTFSEPVYEIYIYAWQLGNKIPSSDGPLQSIRAMVDNLRFTPNPPPPDQDEEEGCENDNMTSNPCNVATGNKYLSKVDYSGGNTELAFKRSYNSYEKNDHGLGIGWTSSYAKRLEIDQGTLVIREGSGKGEKWSKLSGVWEGEADSNLQLIEHTNGFTLTRVDGSRSEFDLLGRIISDIAASQKTTLYAYNPDGQLISVTGPFGHTLSFVHDGQGHLTRMIDPDNQTYTYGYDSEANLVTVTYPDSSILTYHYENAALPHHITGITDRNGDRYSTYTYNSNGTVKTSELADTGNGTMERLTFNYDFSKEETSVVDSAATRKILTFNSNLGVKNLVSELNQSDNRQILKSYDANNNLLTETDEENRVTTYTYNSDNQKISRVEATGTVEERATTYEYYSSTIDLPTRVTRPSVYAGGVSETVIDYDTNLNISSVQENGYDAAGTSISRTVAWTYNAIGQVTSMDGYRTDVNDVTTFTYYECSSGNECGQLSSITNALGHTTFFDDYDANGRLTRSTDVNGLETTYGYDYFGRVVDITQSSPVGNVRTQAYAYDNHGQMITATLADGVVLSYTYDAAHYLRSIVDNAGNKVKYTYDRKGNLTEEKESDPDGTLTRSVARVYDARDQLTSINAGGSVTQMVFNAVGELGSVTDPNLNPSEGNSYDSLSRLVESLDSAGNLFTHGYDTNDNTVEVRAPNNATTTFDYNDFGYLLEELSPDRGTTTYTHDDAGNVVSITDGRGVTASYSYDALNRVTLIDYPGASEDIDYTYDDCTSGLGRLCQSIDESGITDFTYDAFGNALTVIKDEIGVVSTIQYSYDKANRVASMVYPDDSVITYERNSIGRIAGVDCIGCGAVSSVVYDRQYRSDGQLLSQYYGSGMQERREYDLQGRLTMQTIDGVLGREYVYDANGNILNKGSYKYLYDELDRLTSEKVSGKADTFSYDGNGNRLTYAKDDYTYRASSNVLTSVESSPVVTDAVGNTTEIRDLLLTYNQAGRISQIENTTTGEITSYYYNAFGQRTRKVSSAGTSLFYYDSNGHLIAESDLGKSLVSKYLWADDMPVAQDAITQITTTTGKGKNRVTTITYENEFVYLHTDNIYTPRRATNALGELVWEWDYDSFGVVTADTDPDGNDATLEMMLRFPGQYFDVESGLHYNYFRTYDPGTGRYVTSDPIGLHGGFNTYAFVSGNPLRYVDFLGLEITGTWSGFNVAITDWEYTGLTPHLERGPGGNDLVDRIGYFNFLVSGILGAGVKCQDTDDCGNEQRDWTQEGSVSVDDIDFQVPYDEPLFPVPGMGAIIWADKVWNVGQYAYQWRRLIELAGKALLNTPTAICKGSSFLR